MRRPSQFAGRRALQFNVTPLIDIVFLLIIFFLVASHFVRSDSAEAVDLPTASRGVSDEQPAHRLTITVLDGGQLSISGQRLSRAQVFQRIANLAVSAQEQNLSPQVRIRADQREHLGAIRPLLEEVAGHGISSMQFAVAAESR